MSQITGQKKIMTTERTVSEWEKHQMKSSLRTGLTKLVIILIKVFVRNQQCVNINSVFPPHR